jgi:hypothetical protein
MLAYILATATVDNEIIKLKNITIQNLMKMKYIYNLSMCLIADELTNGIYNHTKSSMFLTNENIISWTCTIIYTATYSELLRPS